MSRKDRSSDWLILAVFIVILTSGSDLSLATKKAMDDKNFSQNLGGGEFWRSMGRAGKSKGKAYSKTGSRFGDGIATVTAPAFVDVGRTVHESDSGDDYPALKSFVGLNQGVFTGGDKPPPMELETGDDPGPRASVMDDIGHDGHYPGLGSMPHPVPGDGETPPPLNDPGSDAGHIPLPASAGEQSYLNELDQKLAASRALFDPDYTVAGHDPNAPKPDVPGAMQKGNGGNESGSQGSVIDEVESVIVDF